MIDDKFEMTIKTCRNEVVGINLKTKEDYINSFEEGIEAVSFDYKNRHFNLKREDFISYLKKMSGLRFIDWQTHVCNYVVELKAQEIFYNTYIPYIDESQIKINFDNPAQYSKALFHQAGLEVK